MHSKIRLANSQDLLEIKSLTEACTIAMQQKNILQWNDDYPNLEILQQDIERQELYVLEEKSIIGIIVLTDFMDTEYKPVSWLTSEESKNLYIHRFATSPKVWGEGIGRKLMDFAENFARKNNYASIRLDTFNQNKRNQRFYEMRGYTRLDDIYFPKQSEYPFHCYELVL